MQSPFLELRVTQAMGRGVFAVEDIPPRTLLVQVHKSRFITYSMLTEHPLLDKLMNRMTHRIVEFSYFLAYSHYQKQENNINQLIKNYLSQIPETYNNLICWPEEDLNRLRNRELVSKIKEKKNNYLLAYQQISQFLTDKTREESPPKAIQPEPPAATKSRGSRIARRQVDPFDHELMSRQRTIIQAITFEDILKYVAVVQSRNAYYVDKQDSKSLVGALVPKLQLFNHSKHSKCAVELKQDYYKVTTTAPISKGEEVFLDYGVSSIESSLQFYGMIPDEQIQGCIAEWDKQQQKQNCALPSTEKAMVKSKEWQSERERLISVYNSWFQEAPGVSPYQLSCNPRAALLQKNV